MRDSRDGKGDPRERTADKADGNLQRPGRLEHFSPTEVSWNSLAVGYSLIHPA